MAETFVQNESIETVIQRYKATVYSVALSYVNNREDADDIFQEVFLIYFRTNPQFNEEEHRKAWLIRTTINCSKRVVDSTYRKRTVPLDEMEEESFQFQTKEENKRVRYRTKSVVSNSSPPFLFRRHVHRHDL